MVRFFAVATFLVVAVVAAVGSTPVLADIVYTCYTNNGDDVTKVPPRAGEKARCSKPDTVIVDRRALPPVNSGHDCGQFAPDRSRCDDGLNATAVISFNGCTGNCGTPAVNNNCTGRCGTAPAPTARKANCPANYKLEKVSTGAEICVPLAPQIVASEGRCIPGRDQPKFIMLNGYKTQISCH